jgi:hypothetical protein
MPSAPSAPAVWAKTTPGEAQIIDITPIASRRVFNALFIVLAPILYEKKCIIFA